MPRQSKIRFKRGEQEELRRLNKSVSNKKSRLKREFGVEMDISTRPVSSFTSRKELNAYKEEMRAFTNPNAHRYVKNDKGVSMPRNLLNQINRELKRVNRLKDQQLKRIKDQPFTDRGKPTPMTVGQQNSFMGDPRYDNFRKLKFNPNRFNNVKEAEQYMKFLKSYTPKQLAEWNERYKQNYIKAIDNVFGSTLAGDLIDHIKKMDTKEFIDLYYSENIADIGFIYDFIALREKMSALKGVFGL